MEADLLAKHAREQEARARQGKDRQALPAPDAQRSDFLEENLDRREIAYERDRNG